MKYEFEKLREKYGSFSCPAATVTVDGKPFEANSAGMILGELTVELTCSQEASFASFRIYNCTDSKTGEFLTEQLKPYILFGSCVSIGLGYAGEKEEVFRGFIARVGFEKEEEEIPCVEVGVSDIKGMMAAFFGARHLKAADYGGAVRELLQSEVYQELGEKGLLEHLKVTDTPDKGSKINETEQKRIQLMEESDYEFVIRAAAKFGYEFFMDLGTAYFRKARSDDTLLLELEPLGAVQSLQTYYDVRGLVKELEVRSTDDGSGDTLGAKKKYQNKLSLGNKVNRIVAKTKKIHVDSSLRTKEEAAHLAESILTELSYCFGNMECECVGIPELKPGWFMGIKGFGGLCDNRFYITQVKHSLTQEQGYCTHITGQAASLNNT